MNVAQWLDFMHIAVAESRDFAADASAKKVFRYIRDVHGQEYLVLQGADAAQYFVTSQLLMQAGITTPRVYAKRGDMLLMEYVSGKALSSSNDSDYCLAILTLQDFASIPTPASMPVVAWPYIKAELLRFTGYFPQAVLQNDAWRNSFVAGWGAWMQHNDFAACMRYFVHLDFHGDNVIVSNNKLYVIDFQDCAVGSNLYDGISLFEDPRQAATPIHNNLYREWQASVLLNSATHSLFLFERLRRHTRVCGTLARLVYQQQRMQYLPILNNAEKLLHEVVLQLCQCQPELADLYFECVNGCVNTDDTE